MAGSLSHITRADGSFDMGLIENMGDAHEALEECHQIIAELLETVVKNAQAGGHSRGAPMGVDWDSKEAVIGLVCKRLGFPVPEHHPVVNPDLHGAASIYKEKSNA